MYILSIEELAAVNIASSKGGARYYLQGVVVERGDKSAALIATDGHRLHIIGDVEDEKGEIFIIPNDVVKRIILCAKSFKGEISRPLTLAVAITDKEWKIITLLHSQHKEFIGQKVRKLPEGSNVLLSGAYKPIDGTFPDYRKVLPKKPEEPLQMEPFFLNAAYLADINKTRTLLGTAHQVKFDASAGKDSPISFTFTEYPRFRGIIMPTRG